MTVTLQFHPDQLSVIQFPITQPFPLDYNQIFEAKFCSLTKTKTEWSLVTSASVDSEKTEKDWQALEILGPLDFSLVGIIAKLTAVLMENSISVFVMSTFDTDWILIKQSKMVEAIHALRNAGYTVIDE
ncbi:ACT domain-containing protein [Gorgonomyces haynaldii]|nr:ACT domain-containing protein [Gorgonomyces haynaldii]